MKAFRPIAGVDTVYLWQLMKGLEYEILTFCTKIGATVDSIEMEYLQNFEVAVAPAAEQLLISSYITENNERVAETTEIINQEIALLQEYRAALIAEAVTGQIDVRDYAPVAAVLT